MQGGKGPIKRVTIKDISEAAGVSVTTVYKALNDKPKVSEETRRAILDIAKKMDYRPNKLAQSLARNSKTIGFISPAYPENFTRYVFDGVESSIKDLLDYNFHVTIKAPRSQQETIKAAGELIADKVNGIIILSNQVVPGFNNLLVEKGVDIPIAAIVSAPTDGTPLIGMVRSDGFVLGRLAAQFLSLCIDKSKQVAIFLPEEDATIHRECYKSFVDSSTVFGLKMPKRFTSSFEGVEANKQITRRVIEENENIAGIYVASNNSVGMCKCLEDMGRTDIKVIGHDLHPELAGCMERGSLHATLFQNQYLQARNAVDLMFRHLTESRKPFGERFLRPELVMLSNLSCYKNMY